MRVQLIKTSWLLVVISLLATAASLIATPPAEAQSSFDQKLIQLVNDHRTSNGLQPLAVSSSISAGALSWSRTMLNGHPNSFGHATNLGQLGENIAWSQGVVGQSFNISWQRSAPLPGYCTATMDYTSAEFFVCGWLDSPPHRRSIDNAAYRQIGSGTVSNGPTNARITYATHRFSTQAPAVVAPTATPTPRVTTPVDIAEPGHSIAANSRGDQVTIGLKADGKLWIRRRLVGSTNKWQSLGAGDWVAADVTVDPSGAAHVAAIKMDGTLYTNKWSNNGSWSGWKNHGGGWDKTTMPSIDSNSSQTVLAAITASGQLKTKLYNSSWSSASTHGSGGWAQVDIAIAADGDLWFAAVKDNGRLFVRKHIGDVSWSGFNQMGQANWSAETAPAIDARSNGVVFGAVKQNGRLYTRAQTNNRWAGFVRHGNAAWASVDVAMSEQGHVVLGAHKDWGRLYTRNQTASGAWSGWSRQGADTWAAETDPSVALGASNRGLLAAAKTAGLLYTRTQGASSWNGWSQFGSGSWAAS